MSTSNSIIFIWICALGLKKIRNSISTEDSLDVFFKRAYKGELSLRKRADLFSIWQASKPGVLDVLDTYGLRNLSTSSSSRKLLQNLQQAIEKEIPSLRRKVDFSASLIKKEEDRCNNKIASMRNKLIEKSETQLEIMTRKLQMECKKIKEEIERLQNEQ